MAYVVSSGVTSTGIVLNNDSMTIMDGGLAIDTAADVNGEMTVSSGGSASGVTVNPWGNLYIFGTGLDVRENGGYVYADAAEEVTFIPNSFGGLVIENRGATLHSGTTAADITIGENGEVDVSSGGIVSRATVNPGGAIRSYEGTLSEIRENGGYVFAFGDASFVSNTISGLTLGSASATLHSGTTANSTVLNDYGILDVFGGSANSVTVNRGGFMRIREGKVLEVVENGGYVEYYETGPDENVTFTPNAISDLVLEVGYSATLHSGTTAANTALEESSLLEVFSGGTANTVQADSGSWLNLHEGVNATGLTLESGVRFDVTVAPGTYVQGTSAGAAFLVENAYMENFQANEANEVHVMSGGSVSNIRLNFSSFMGVGGSASRTVISGGLFYVYYGGTASNTTLNTGRMNIYSGGTASATAVTGGVMEVSSGGNVTGSLQIDTGAVVSAYEGSIIDFDISEFNGSSTVRVNDLSLISGTPTYTITVSADQAAGTYSLAGGAAEFTGTLSLGTDGANYGTVTVNGEALAYGDHTYSLATSDDSLLLTVEAVVPPTPPVLTAQFFTGHFAGAGNALHDVVVYRETEGGLVNLLANNGTGIFSPVEFGAAAEPWQLIGVGDFNGDHISDVLWRNMSIGDVGSWLGDGAYGTSWQYMAGAAVGEWEIVGVGDFNGDATDDVLWYNTETGLMLNWQVQNGVYHADAIIAGAAPGEWRFSGVGDFNGDGTDDILWHNQISGAGGYWAIQNGTYSAWCDLAGADPEEWTMIGIGDFDANGYDDVLWLNNDTGLVGCWANNSTGNVEWNTLAGAGDLDGWHYEGVGDFDNDGRSDVLWAHDGGAIGAWITATDRIAVGSWLPIA